MTKTKEAPVKTQAPKDDKTPVKFSDWAAI